MQKDYEDAEHNIRQLTRDVQNKDQEIKFLTTELTRYKVNCIYVNHFFNLAGYTDSCTPVKTYNHSISASNSTLKRHKIEIFSQCDLF